MYKFTEKVCKIEKKTRIFYVALLRFRSYNLGLNFLFQTFRATFLHPEVILQQTRTRIHYYKMYTNILFSIIVGWDMNHLYPLIAFDVDFMVTIVCL